MNTCISTDVITVAMVYIDGVWIVVTTPPLLYTCYGSSSLSTLGDYGSKLLVYETLPVICV